MDASKEAERGLTDIEAYLYREAHLQAARQRVAAFTARAPGLTREQKTDIERWYLDEQQYVARQVTEHISDRISLAEEQHHVRFRHWLRGTATAMALITAVMLCFAVMLGTLN
ncbi:hypothetical protein EDD90_9373 [Streptomyces sp. Ag109_O5-1]|uniref:hypothetical protein n=1 Tax=Streptomyces sp. Ag109_O5-1 TaxID=1938851 RepID=UPI000F4ECDE6|nr:hypothetical protein [Streptomyces sp. Ag109_O5-1]RPE46052.1 hypothetical protein EDD90_9373 [Streptomyces sp. Ag109_O5-1]